MNKVVRLALLAALVLSLFTFGVVGAQTGVDAVDVAVTYQTGIQIQNLEGTDAVAYLEFYKADGTLDVSPAPQVTVPANGSKTVFPVPTSSGFTGSLVVTSSTELRAISNLLGSGPGDYLAATNGFQAGATEINLPLVMCNNSGFDTFFSVQNAGASLATITVNYVPGSNGTARSEGATIPPGAAKIFDQTAGSTTVNCSTLQDGSGKFIGSAKITSDQPVVATLMQVNTTGTKTLLGYGSFTQGSATVALPLIFANNNGFFSGIQVQNVGTTTTSVTVAYAPNTAGAFDPADETFDLAAGASKTILQSGGAWGTNKYIGGATITNTNSQPLVAIVNQLRPTPAFGSAYEGFNPAAATTKISAPLVMANNSTYFTGIQVQNVSVGSVTVTLDYGANTAGAFAPVDETFTLAAGESKTILQSGGAWGTNKYIGSATITGNGSIAAIVNQLSLSVAGDQFATYDAFNY